jgi:hypothetical protein
MNLVATPGTSVDELFQLNGNPDELCALIASHIVEGEYVSTDVTTSGVTLPTLDNDIDGIFVQLVNGKVYADGALVSTADLFASNGVVHIVDAVLLPQSVGTINPIVTDQTSPALSGTITTPMTSTEHEEVKIDWVYCVVVRVDGIPYVANVDGSNWTIEEGIVSLNPTKTDTLFDVVVRVSPWSCDWEYEEDAQPYQIAAEMSSEVVTHGLFLVGLTMNRGVVSYLETEEPTDEGEVLGETTDNTPVVPEPTTEVVLGVSCGGKIACEGSSNYDPTKVDSDGDGVVDSEDSDPYDPSVTGQEEADTSDDANSNEENSENESASEDSQNAIWWFVAGGGIVAAWYLLWQRSAREE